MRHSPEDDFDRFGFTRHELLSTGSAAAPGASLGSAPQATFEVTTLADVVDANDGVLSLREAIQLSNDTPGLDTITFADSIRGGTIALDIGTLAVTDDETIDGDPADGGPGGIVIDGSGGPLLAYGFVAFTLDGVTARFEDLTIKNAYNVGIETINSDLNITRVGIVEFNEAGGIAPSVGISAIGGTVTVVESTIGYSDGGLAAGIEIEGTSVEVRDSRIINNRGEYGFGISGDGRVRVVDSAISDNGANRGFGIDIEGDLLIESSTLARNGTAIGLDRSGAVRIDGSLVIVNSTIADSASGDTNFYRTGGAVTVLGRSTASIVNSTITGTGVGFTYGSLGARDTYGVGTGIYAAAGSVVEVNNSIIDDSVDGTITSNGANTFRDATVTGAAGADRLGVSADQLFALTEEIGSTGIRAGVLADNGGPTQTVALLNSPDNPALDSADPADAPPTDQRGFARDATPDIGAFELGPTTLPPLAEGVPVPDEAINSVPREALTLTGGRDAAISFVDEYAGFQNSLGVYLVGPDGEIMAPRWVFERIEHAVADDSVDSSVRPGNGPSQPGETVLLSDLYDPQELQEGTEFGLFLVADGAARNPFIVFDGGTLDFRTGGDPAKVTDVVPQLVHTSETGTERVVLGDIMHTVDAGSPNPLSNKLNPPPEPPFRVGGRGQALSGLLDGQFTIAFEDQPLNFGDRDFNDLLVAVELLDASPALLAAPTSAGDMVSAVASLEALVVAGETTA